MGRGTAVLSDWPLGVHPTGRRVGAVAVAGSGRRGTMVPDAPKSSNDEDLL